MLLCIVSWTPPAHLCIDGDRVFVMLRSIVLSTWPTLSTDIEGVGTNQMGVQVERTVFVSQYCSGLLTDLFLSLVPQRNRHKSEAQSAQVTPAFFAGGISAWNLAAPQRLRWERAWVDRPFSERSSQRKRGKKMLFIIFIGHKKENKNFTKAFQTIRRRPRVLFPQEPWTFFRF
jgi:hypothetical protein